MNKLLTLACCLLSFAFCEAQTAGQFVFQQKNSGSGYTLIPITPEANKVLGFDGDALLTLTTAVASWADITDKPTDLAGYGLSTLLLPSAATTKARISQSDSGELLLTVNLDVANANAIDDDAFSSWAMTFSSDEGPNGFSILHLPGNDGDWTNATTLFSLNDAGQLTATSFAGLGASITGLNMNNVSAGTLAVARGGTGISSLGTGIATWLGTPSSANLAAALTDKTGTGAAVFANSPTLVTPILGAASATGLTLSGTVGNGGVKLLSQSLDPSTPASGFAFYANASGDMTWRRQSDTFHRTFTGAITTDRSYTLPDASITIAGTNVGNGGTGITTATAYAVLCGGTTGTGAFQCIASVGTAGQVLTSNGAGALPTFQTTATLGANTFSGHQLYSADNTYDIGASGATRPRSGYFGTSVSIAGNGTGSTPCIVFAGRGTNYGLFSNSSLEINTTFNGTQRHTFWSDGSLYLNGTASEFNLPSAGFISWGTTLFLYRDGAGVLQFGADAATATHQAIKAGDGVGTDKAGFNFTFAGGQSTGTGRGGDTIEKTSNSSTTGSTSNSYSTRRYVSAKHVDLTESTATAFANLAVAASKYAGASLTCTITANDGTDFQSLTSQIRIDAVNKAGTVTTTITQTDNTTAASAGTLTCTYTAVVNGNSVDIKANATSSLTQTVLRAKWIVTGLNSDGTDTSAVAGSLVTPQ